MKDCTQQAVVFSKPNCPQCVVAKALLDANGVCIEERVVGVNASIDDVFEAVGKVVRSVPQVILNGTHVEGMDALREALASA